ncbi:MAG: MotA/TolQ/ExbB proton channel family protein [Maricaulaceae bacterium]
MKFQIKTIALAAALGTFAVVNAAPALAQPTPEPASTLQGVIDRILSDSREMSAESREREARFRRERDQQARLLVEAEQELEDLIAEGERLTLLFEENEERIRELNEELTANQGDFGELFGVARQAALDITGQMSSSNIAAQPGVFMAETELGEDASLLERLEDLSETERLPTQIEMDAVWKTLIQEMVYQRQVVTFTGRVANIGGDGSSQEVPVTRIGPFTLFATPRGSGAQFVTADEGAMTVLARQPAARYTSAAQTVARANPGQIVAGPIDPSRGTLMGIIIDAPSLQERFEYGGIVGKIIAVLAVIGVIFGLLRLFQLFMVGSAVRGQARKSRASKGNPLGKIMLAAEDARSADIETFELKLDEAIVRESAGLDFGLNLIKLLAAITPMLGLLGTVTGMIITFQQITLFGAGDPQIMASGISQALITTVLGLYAAIPLMFIHSFCASASRGVQEVLEQQAAGIVARHAEARRAG